MTDQYLGKCIIKEEEEEEEEEGVVLRDVEGRYSMDVE